MGERGRDWACPEKWYLLDYQGVIPYQPTFLGSFFTVLRKKVTKIVTMVVCGPPQKPHFLMKIVVFVGCMYHFVYVIIQETEHGGVDGERYVPYPQADRRLRPMGNMG